MFSVSTATQLWNRVTPWDPEDRGDMFSETSVRTRTARFKVPEGIYDYIHEFSSRASGKGGLGSVLVTRQDVYCAEVEFFILVAVAKREI
jgi:hypothetical protein